MKRFIYEKRKIVYCIILLVLVSLLVMSVFSSTNKIQRPYKIDNGDLIFHGYSKEGTQYTNMVGDAHIHLPQLNKYVEIISLGFSSPLKQPLNITIYYADEGHGYSEEYTVYAESAENSTSTAILVGRYITTCRIDIGTQAGEIFELEHITINEPSVWKLGSFRQAIAILFLVLLVTIGYHLLQLQWKQEKIWLGICLGVGLLYLISITPFSVPDELHHYHSAYQLSNGILMDFSGMEYGDSAYFDYSDFAGHRNVSSGYIRILRDFNKPFRPGEAIPIPTPRGLSYFVEYLPQAIGIAIARITNQNFIRLFLLGRLCNLLFYSGCLYFAVRRTPKFKTMFGVIGVMPMALHQAASYSYDGFINGVSLFLTASILKAIYEKDILSRKDFLCILASGALLAPAKLVYCPLLLLVILIPEYRFGNRKGKLTRISLIWITTILFMVGFQLPTLLSQVGEKVQELNYEGYYNYTLSFIFEHPFQTAEIFWNTLQKMAVFWFRCALGQAMSGLTLVTPSWIINFYIITIFLSVLNHEKSDYVLCLLNRICILIVCAMVIGFTMLSMFLFWTSNIRLEITGVQGRYFIPIMPLLALSTNNQILILRKNVDKLLVISTVLLNGCVITNILNYTLGY